MSAEQPEAFAVGAGDFLTIKLPPLKTLIEYVLTDDGGGFIAGEEKLGKTFYALCEALALATGERLCGRFAVTEQCRVLFVEEEDSPRRTQRRLRALLRGMNLDPDDPDVQAELSKWFRLVVWQHFRLDDPQSIAKLKKELAAFPAQVVYLDVLRKIHQKDLNKADQAAAITNKLDEIQRKMGCLIRVIHHYRKQQGKRFGRGSQELGGSFQLGAWAEQSVYLEPVGRKGGGVSFEVQSKDAAPVPPLYLVIESEGPRHDPTLIRLKLVESDTTMKSPEQSDLISRQMLLAITTFLRTQPEHTARWGEIHKHLANLYVDMNEGTLKSNVNRALSLGKRKKTVESAGPGLYRALPKKEQVAAS